MGRADVYTPQPNPLPQETRPCSDPVNMSLIPPRASSMSTIYPSPLSCPTTPTMPTVPVPGVAHLAYRHKCNQRTLHDLGDLRAGRPVQLVVTYSSHYGSKCHKYFNVD